jgi:hypothetical protein
MTETWLSFIESYPIASAMLAIVIVALLICLFAIRRLQMEARLQRAVSESFHQPLLVYTERGRLAFASSGLKVFDQGALKAVRQLPEDIAGGKTTRGKLEIDSNTYRYEVRTVEYRPGHSGFVLLLTFERR